MTAFEFFVAAIGVAEYMPDISAQSNPDTDLVEWRIFDDFEKQ